MPNSMGVFQGSALGPLLFTVFANDMSLFAAGASVVQYADDTQVIVSEQKERQKESLWQKERTFGCYSEHGKLIDFFGSVVLR